MARQYKVWAVVETHDDNPEADEEYSDSEPEELGEFETKDAATRFLDGLGDAAAQMMEAIEEGADTVRITLDSIAPPNQEGA